MAALPAPKPQGATDRSVAKAVVQFTLHRVAGLPIKVSTVIAGLGGRAITKASLHRVFREAMHDEFEPVHFLDLDRGIVDRVLAREGQKRRTGPIAENILRDLGTLASKSS